MISSNRPTSTTSSSMASRGRSYSPTGGMASIAAGGGVVVGSPPRSVRLSSVNGTSATSPPLAAAAVGGRLTMRRGRDVGVTTTTSPSKQSSSPQQPGMVRRRTTTGSNSSATSKRSSLLHDYTQSHATDVTSPLLLRRCTTGPTNTCTTSITDELPLRKYPKARPIPGADVLGLGDSSSDSDNDLDASGTGTGTNNHHNHNHSHESMDESTESQKSVEELIRFRVRNPNSLPPLVPHHPPVSHLVPTISTASATTTTIMPSAKQLMMARNHKALHSIVEEDKLEPSSRHSSYQSFSSEASSVATWSSSGDRGAAAEKLEDARSSNHSHNQNNNNNQNNPASDPNSIFENTEATDISLVQEESVLVMEDTSMLPKNIPQVTPANNNNNLLEEENVETTTLSRASTLSLDPSLLGTDNNTDGPSEVTDTDGSPTRDNHKLSARESLAASRDDILNGRDEGRASLSPPLSPIPNHAGSACAGASAASRNRITTPVSTHHHKDRLMRAVAKVVQDIPPHKSRRKSSGTHDHGSSSAAGPPTLKRRPTADSVLGTCTTTRVVPTITTTSTTNSTTNTTASSSSSMEGSGRSGRLGAVRRTRSDDRECASPTTTNTINTGDANNMEGDAMNGSARRGPALRRTQSSDGAGGALARMRRAGRRSGPGTAGTATGTGDVAMEESSRRTVARTRSSDGAGFANSARGRALRRSAGQAAAADDIKADVKKHGLRRSQSAVGADKDPVAGSSSGGGGMDGSGRRSLSPSRRSVAAAKDSGFGANHPARFNSSRIKRWDKEEVREIGLSSSSFAGHELQKMLKSHSNGLYYS